MSAAAPFFTDLSQLNPQELDYRRLTASVNDMLIERGHLVAFNYVMHQAAVELQQICEDMVRAPTPAERDRCYAEANVVMAQYCFAPGYRAFMLHRAQQLPHIRDVAHAIEAATINYYRQDYLAATLLLAPAVENLMNRHVGYDISQGSLDSVSLRNKIAATRSTATQRRFCERYPLLQWYVMRFLNERYFEKTGVAKFGDSYLHRHYMLHGLGNETFYTFADCQTLFQFFDMYLEMLTCENDDNILAANKWGAVPISEGEIPQRTLVYWRLIVTRFLYGLSDEERLLRLNPNYAPELEDTNYVVVRNSTPLRTLLSGVMFLLDTGGDKKSLRGLPLASDRQMIPARRQMLAHCIDTLQALGYFS